MTDTSGEHAAALAGHNLALALATARIRELEGERDELLGLVRDLADTDGRDEPPWWVKRARAIVARIEKATKGTR